MRATYEWQEVMLAHGIKFNVLDQDDLTRIGAKDGAINYFINRLPVTLSKKLKGARGPARCAKQTFPLAIFTDSCKEIGEELLHFLQPALVKPVYFSR